MFAARIVTAARSNVVPVKLKSSRSGAPLRCNRPGEGSPVALCDLASEEHQGKLDCDQVNGCRLNLSVAEADILNFKLLATTRAAGLRWIVPGERVIELLFFRRMFTRLIHQTALCRGESIEEQREESVPITTFHRTFGRLFHALRDPQGFDAKNYDKDGNGHVGWTEFCYVWKDRHIRVRLSMWERIYLTFDDPHSSILAHVISVFILLTIIISSACFILSTVPEFQDIPEDGATPIPKVYFFKIEQVCLAIFVLEYLLRIGTCWAVREELFDTEGLLEIVVGYERIELSTPFSRLVKFVFAIPNIIDLAAILPGVVSFWISSTSTGFIVLRLVRLTRIVRVFRIGKFVEPVSVICRTVRQSTKALYVLAFNLLLGVVIFGSLMFLIEQGEWDETDRVYKRVVNKVWNPESREYEEVLVESPFKSIPHTFWWALVTSTTVGYGDHYPTSNQGYLVAMLCMVWSLVILALPVGVIGGTFTQVWDDFAKQKKYEADMMRREMSYVAAAIQKIEPSKVSRLVLFEVWNDGGGPVNTPASPEDFMGEAKVKLELTPHQSVRSRELRLPLEPNHHVVKRQITGNLVIRYDWTPAEEAAQIPAGDGENCEDFLKGTLSLTLVSAERLIHTDWGGKGGTSNPYVMILCYPKSPEALHDVKSQLRPVAWRGPTAQHTLFPKWEASHSFEYNWGSREDNDGRRPSVPAPAPDLKTGSLCLGSNRNGVQNQPCFGDPPAANATHATAAPLSADEVMQVLQQLAVGMPQLTVDLALVKDEVRSLSRCVNELQASLGDRPRNGRDGQIHGGCGENARCEEADDFDGLVCNGRRQPDMLPNTVPFDHDIS